MPTFPVSKCNASGNPGRRAFLKLSGLAALGSGLGSLTGTGTPPTQAEPTHLLRIRAAKVELAPGRCISTLTYDGQFPGPLLRAPAGSPVRIDVYNQTGAPERIRWHGQHVAPETTLVPAHSVRRMQFIPERPGLFFYHSEQISALQLDTGLYSGQVGALLVESPGLPVGPQHVVVLKDFEPWIRRARQGCEIGYRALTVDGHLQGRAPARIPMGQPALVHVLNASATETLSLGLPGHSFEVAALDGNALPTPVNVPALLLHPGERMSAWVTLDRPAAWVARPAAGETLDYNRFGSGIARAPDETHDVVLARHEAARSGFNRWSINGASFQAAGDRPLMRVRLGSRYRLRIRNSSDEILPLHLQRHRLEVVSVAGRPVAGVLKDVVAIGAHQSMEVDFTADSSGPALFHCTRQLHKDFGLMALVEYV